MPGVIRIKGRRNKYNAKRTTRVIDGKVVTFHSKAEAERWDVLKAMEERGEISHLLRQVKYSLSVWRDGEDDDEHICDYIADFVYLENNRAIVEDVKGYRDAVYKLKKKLMLACHGITIREITPKRRGKR